MAENEGGDHETLMQGDLGYYYKDSWHDDGYAGAAYDSSYEHPVHNSDYELENAEQDGCSHNDAVLLDELASHENSLMADDNCYSYEYVEHEAPV